jgi:Tfp pilus assembly protein PilZ
MLEAYMHLNPLWQDMIMNLKTQGDNELPISERIHRLVGNLTEEKKELLLDMLLEWQQKEQRDDPRIPCLIAVDYSDCNRVYHDFIQDLSRGGVFIETREPLEIGETMALTFTMPGSDNHFKMLGKIVRVGDGGFGVQFINKLSQYQEEIIKTLMGRKKK